MADVPLALTNVRFWGDCVAKLTAPLVCFGACQSWCFVCSAAVSRGWGGNMPIRARLTQRRRLAPSAVVVRHTWRAFSSSGRWQRAEPRRGRRSSPSADEQLACAMQHQAALLLWRLGLDKPHVRPGDRFADGLGVSGIVLLSLDVGLHVGRRHQAHGMPRAP
jgi:hypothetical protein